MYDEFLNEWSRNWFQYILDNPNKPWNYECLSKNKNITWSIIQSNPNKPWNYECLSKNPNITWSIIQANPNKPWDYNCIFSNPNITFSSENNIYEWFKLIALKKELWNPNNYEKFRYFIEIILI